MPLLVVPTSGFVVCREQALSCRVQGIFGILDAGSGKLTIKLEALI